MRFIAFVSDTAIRCMYRMYHLKQREALALYRSQDFPDSANIADFSETSESEGEMNLRVAIALEERQKVGIQNRRRASNLSVVAHKRPGHRAAQGSVQVAIESQPESPELPGMVPSQPPVTRARARPIRYIAKPLVTTASNGENGGDSSFDSDLEAARRELQRPETVSTSSPAPYSEVDELSRVTDADAEPDSAFQSVSGAPPLRLPAAIESSSAQASAEDAGVHSLLHASTTLRVPLDATLNVQVGGISSAAAQLPPNDKPESDENVESVATMRSQLESLRSEVSALRAAAEDSERRAALHEQRTREANATVAFLMRKLEAFARRHGNASPSPSQPPPGISSPSPLQPPHSSQRGGMMEEGGVSGGQTPHSSQQQLASPAVSHQRQGSVPLDDKTKRLLMQVHATQVTVKLSIIL